STVAAEATLAVLVFTRTSVLAAEAFAFWCVLAGFSTLAAEAFAAGLCWGFWCSFFSTLPVAGEVVVVLVWHSVVAGVVALEGEVTLVVGAGAVTLVLLLAGAS